MSGDARTAPADLAAALEAYLDHLRVERGLAGATIRAYDVSGDRFLINVPAAGQSAAPMTLVNHWQPQTGHGTTETRKEN